MSKGNEPDLILEKMCPLLNPKTIQGKRVVLYSAVEKPWLARLSSVELSLAPSVSRTLNSEGTIDMQDNGEPAEKSVGKTKDGGLSLSKSSLLIKSSGAPSVAVRAEALAVSLALTHLLLNPGMCCGRIGPIGAAKFLRSVAAKALCSLTSGPNKKSPPLRDM